MNISNWILKVLSFNQLHKISKDLRSKFLAISVVCFTFIVFFLIHFSISYFIENDSVSSLISASTSIILTIYFIIVLSSKEKIPLPFFPSVIIGIVFLFYLFVGSIGYTGTLIIGVFPIITNITLGFRKGLYLSFIFLALSIIGFVFPALLFTTEPVGLSLKLTSFLSYLLVILILYVIEILKQEKINDMEKQVLDQKSYTKLKEEFIANLSHQIRTPLNNIMVITNILESTDIDEKQRDMIDTIHASTNNLVNVVNSMVEISNVDIKERSDLSINFNLNSTISNTIKLFSTQNSGQTTFNLKIDESIPKDLTGDPVKIKQIFLNLVENILKNKSSAKTTIEIKVWKSKENDDVVDLNFEIKSNKPILLPVNEGHNLYVTNETILSSASTQMYIDLLDLTITQKLIESNGGKLSIILSSENAVFSFPYNLKKSTLQPVKEDESYPSDDGVEGKIVKTISKTTLDLSDANVLLVEDNLINQKIVVLSLKKIVKSIDIANNGKEALDKFGTSRFDIILMDIQMPIMNGIIATKKIREIESSSNTHTPIIAITANALLGDKEECLAAGMDDYISKPFQIEVLIQKMKNLLK
ncbi:MAG TPA: response regulator [Tenuifilaceae bacterium]|nr:response regulator [Tenuifilaceae bacterium]HPJ45783.1 response regulator [Tenuifilaceae bacterium]